MFDKSAHPPSPPITPGAAGAAYGVWPRAAAAACAAGPQLAAEQAGGQEPRYGANLGVGQASHLISVLPYFAAFLPSLITHLCPYIW